MGVESAEAVVKGGHTSETRISEERESDNHMEYCYVIYGMISHIVPPLPMAMGSS